MNLRVRHNAGRWPAVALVAAVGLGAPAGSVWGSPVGRPGAGAWLLGVEVQQRSFDTMSAGDWRPVARADAGVRVSVDRLLTRRWAVGLSGHYGGTWLDWSDPLSLTAGKIEDAAWDVRLGVDRVVPFGERSTATIGVGVEYGEAHSWVRTLGPHSGVPGGLPINQRGPRCFATGGYARLGATVPLWSRVGLGAQVSQSFYGAHASDPPFGTRYNWLGRSFAASVGLRFVLARGRAEDAAAPAR